MRAGTFWGCDQSGKHDHTLRGHSVLDRGVSGELCLRTRGLGPRVVSTTLRRITVMKFVRTLSLLALLVSMCTTFAHAADSAAPMKKPMSMDKDKMMMMNGVP